MRTRKRKRHSNVVGRPYMAKSERIVFLRRELTERGMTTREMADLCGVSRATIYRDLLELQCPANDACRLPLTYQRRGVWSVLKRE